MEKLFVGDGEVKVEGDVIDLETRLSVIQALTPLGLEAVADLLQQEVEQLAGVRYARKGSEQAHRRWGSQKGSVYLMDQKLPLGFGINKAISGSLNEMKWVKVPWFLAWGRG